jgi:hypothetical protein
LDFTPTTETVSFGNGETSKTVSVPIVNDTDVEGDEYFYLGLTSPGTGVILANDSGTVSISDDDGPPPSAGMLQFSAGSYSAAENVATADFTIERVGGSTGEVSVHYYITGGTATPDDEYVPVSGTVTFGDGDTTPRTIPIELHDDAVSDGNKTIELALDNVTGGADLGLSTAQITITDNEAVSVIWLDPASYTVGEGDGFVYVTVTRTGDTGPAVSATLITGGDTAQPEEDFTPTTQTVNFASGETSQIVAVPIVDDSVVEGEESFLLG